MITFAQIGLNKVYLTSAIPQDTYKRPGAIPEPSAKLVMKKEEAPVQKSVTSSGLIMQISWTNCDNILFSEKLKLEEGARLHYITHVRVYADLLFRAGLLEARLEVLSVTREPEPDSIFNNLDTECLGKSLSPNSHH
jgi:hypothetical protein